MPFLVIVVLSLIALMLISNSTLKPIREIIATSKQYAAGNFNARIDVHTDNEFGELARYMEEMADELSRSNEYRRSFISNISHDFRSPLTSIKGYIEAMIDGTIPPDKHEKYLQIVLSETTLFGRRSVFSTGVIACVYIEIHLWKSVEEVGAYAYNGAFYSHYQLMHYLLCSWLYRWF